MSGSTKEDTALAWDGSTPQQEGDMIQRHLEGADR